VENAVAMHVLNCFEQLIYVRLHSRFWEIVGPTFDSLVQIHVHNLKHKGEPPCWLVVQDLNELDDVIMRTKPLKRLNLA